MPERAGQRRREVGQDVGVQVGGDDRVQRLGLEGHPHGHGVDQHLVPGDVRELLRHLGRDLVPHHHAVALGVGLGDHGQQLARPRLGEREGVAHDPGDTGAGEDHHLGADLMRQAAMRAAALAGILALRVLAHDHPVQLLGGDLAQWAGDAGQDARRADVGVLVERLADREPQAPERDVVGHVRRTDGAEVECVEAAQLLVPTGRHHDAVLLVVVRAPVEVGDVELEPAVALGADLEHLEAGCNDFWPDAVTWNCGDLVRAHVRSSRVWGVPPASGGHALGCQLLHAIWHASMRGTYARQFALSSHKISPCMEVAMPT